MRHALLHLALLLLCPHLSFPAPDATTPPCANLSAFDIGHGNATFARVEGQPDPQRWRAVACPVEMTSTSCYWHNRSRAAELEHRPLPGVCRPFRMEEFLELIRCRTLLFLGDSLAIQFWQAVTCMLPLAGAQIEVDWELRFNNRICPFDPLHCYLRSGCATLPHLRTRLCVLGDTTLSTTSSQLRRLGLAGDSVVVANAGFHLRHPSALIAAVESFLESFRAPNASASPLPRVLWYETPAQHFPTHDGYFDFSRKRPYSHCAPLNLTAAAELDWRNAAVRPLLARAGIPVIPLWRLTAVMWDAHVVVTGRSDFPNLIKTDCTHFCLPSVTQHWATLLTETLWEVISPKPMNCSLEDEVQFTQFTAGRGKGKSRRHHR